MNTPQIVDKIALANQLSSTLTIPLPDAKKLLNEFFDILVIALASGHSIQLRRLFSMQIREIKSKITKHPRTLETITIPKKLRIYFRSSKQLEAEMSLHQQNLQLSRKDPL